MHKLLWNIFQCNVPALHTVNYISPGDKERDRRKKLFGFNIQLNVKLKYSDLGQKKKWRGRI